MLRLYNLPSKVRELIERARTDLRDLSQKDEMMVESSRQVRTGRTDKQGFLELLTEPKRKVFNDARHLLRVKNYIIRMSVGK